ncbi:MAG: hypothetical protein AMS26_00825 [Bacteroides sp. SM23_62]|nr:MAG: hypothetical protein AMS26_00825 [Bacteroides sp. SM23_62]
MGVYDKFTFKPFRGINVYPNPRIQVQVRSEVDTKLTVSPTYSLEPPTYEFLEKEIPGDNSWHTHTFELKRRYFSNQGRVLAVDFYFDRDTSVSKSGKIEMDNFKIAWYLVRATDLEAAVSEGRNINLTWNTTDQLQTGKYIIYRGAFPDLRSMRAPFLLKQQPQVTMIKSWNLTNTISTR